MEIDSALRGVEIDVCPILCYSLFLKKFIQIMCDFDHLDSFDHLILTTYSMRYNINKYNHIKMDDLYGYNL